MTSTASTSPPSRTKLSKYFHKVTTFKKPPKSCLHLPTNKHSTNPLANSTDAFLAKLFASISSLKAAYSELQSAQFPYNGEAVKHADQAVVDELKTLSNLKRSFINKKKDKSPVHVTMLLSEIEEQHALMKMYQITLSRIQIQRKLKDTEISLLQKRLQEVSLVNRLFESRLDSNNCFPAFDSLDLLHLNVTNFVSVLNYALGSIEEFVKVLIRDMEGANWNVDAVVTAIAPDVVFPKLGYKCFAVESYVAREVFEGFCVRSEEEEEEEDRVYNFNQFKELKSLATLDLLNRNPRSGFAKFARAKYMRLVHPKMEFSLYGNLGQRKTLNTWRFPETEFFGAFAEMARRVWVLRCLALAFGEEVSVFRVRKGERFSNVYMESVVGGEVNAEERVAFTVAPGFKIGKQVMQSQVYLSPARVCSGRRRD